VATGKELAQLRHESAIQAVAFRPDGRQALTCSRGGTVRLWEIPTEVPDEPVRLRALVHVLTGRTFDETGFLRSVSEDEWLQANRDLDGLARDLQGKLSAESWHRVQAVISEGEKHWFGTIFHLNKLKQIIGPSSDLLRHRGIARASRNEWSQVVIFSRNRC
jgi:WD40 repeat protein